MLFFDKDKDHVHPTSSHAGSEGPLPIGGFLALGVGCLYLGFFKKFHDS